MPSRDSGCVRWCGQHSALANFSRKFMPAAASSSAPHAIDLFKPLSTVPYTLAERVASFQFDPATKKYTPITPNNGAIKRVKTAYNGEVELPVSGNGHLIANIHYGDTHVQISVYDGKNVSESVVTRLYLSSEVGVQTFISNVNMGLIPVARSGASITTPAPVAEANANAYYGILKYYEMLFCVFNRPGLVPRNHCVVALANIRFTNAFWSGFCMFFGNAGDHAVAGSLPLTGMDVCGHELTHGLQTFTTEFTYQGESGALNESIADVFGVLLEFFVNSSVDTPDWTIGEAFKCIIRSFEDPKSKKQPTCAGGEFWVNPTSPDDEGGVHTNSGVLNYLCYLAINGLKTAYTNDLGVKVLPFAPLPEFQLQHYARAVYDVLESRKLSVDCKLADFANELVTVIGGKYSHNAAELVKTCAKAVGLSAPSGPRVEARPTPAVRRVTFAETQSWEPGTIKNLRVPYQFIYLSVAIYYSASGEIEIVIDPDEFQTTNARWPIKIVFWQLTLEELENIETTLFPTNKPADYSLYLQTPTLRVNLSPFGQDQVATLICVLSFGSPQVEVQVVTPSEGGGGAPDPSE